MWDFIVSGFGKIKHQLLAGQPREVWRAAALFGQWRSTNYYRHI
jgi:hypothetical protein